MTTIYLIRHAEAEGNLFKRIQGQYDSPVTILGKKQIECLERRFADVSIDAVYASDLQRACQTARAIYLPKHLPLHTEPAFREVDMGAWEDVPFGEAMNQDRERMNRFNSGDLSWHAVGGETLGQVQARMTDGLKRVIAANPNRTVAIVGHGTAIRLLLTYLSVSDCYLPEGVNTAVSCLLADENGLHVQWINDSSHLFNEVLCDTHKPKPALVSENIPAELFWFRPWNSSTECELYLKWRSEAWMSSHGTMARYNGDAFLKAVQEHSAYDEDAVQVVLSDGKPAGLIELDFQKESDAGIGFIPFYYVDQAHRKRGLGVQLLGQAISIFRSKGRKRLRLRCAPENGTAYRFYCRCGFKKVGMADDSDVPLYLMERDI